MRVCVIVAALIAACCGPATGQPEVDTRTATPDAVTAKLTECSGGGQAFLIASLQCVPAAQADELAGKAGMPLGIADPKAACRQNDPRRVPGDIIKRLAQTAGARIAPSGIRIIGAIFCDELDLEGLELAYSVVLDRSVLVEGVNARNSRIHGDLSLQNAVLLKDANLARTRLEGSLLMNGSFMSRLAVSDTTIGGSLMFRHGIALHGISLFRLTLTGDLTVRHSALSSFSLQSSPISGVLELSDSEVRCAYHIKANELAYVAAERAGFGGLALAPRREGRPTRYFAWWRRALEHPPIVQLLAGEAVKREIEAAMSLLVDAERGTVAGAELINGCRDEGDHAGFYFFDNHVKASFCLRAFEWMAPRPERFGRPRQLEDDPLLPVSILALNGSKIDSNLIIDLWSDDSSTVRRKLDRTTPAKRKLEAVGVRAGALIYDFTDNERRYYTYLDGLSFDRVQKAASVCSLQSGESDQHVTFVGLTSQVELPSVADVVGWLTKNEAGSSQPFVAFAQAFERAGENATLLRVERATLELQQRTKRWLNTFSRSENPVAAANGDTIRMGALGGISDAVTRAIAGLADLITIAFQWVLWLLADHGLRPGKVVWSVAAVLGAFWLLLRYRLGVVAFEPADDKTAKPKTAPVPDQVVPKLWPVGVLFLFDRLIPAYQIRDEHHKIANFYRRASAAEIATRVPDAPPYAVQYLGQEYLVSPMNGPERERVEHWLVWLRAIGLCLAVFLLAAINALIAR